MSELFRDDVVFQLKLDTRSTTFRYLIIYNFYNVI
jgi:hypothetical protein